MLEYVQAEYRIIGRCADLLGIVEESNVGLSGVEDVPGELNAWSRNLKIRNPVPQECEIKTVESQSIAETAGGGVTTPSATKAVVLRFLRPL